MTTSRLLRRGAIIAVVSVLFTLASSAGIAPRLLSFHGLAFADKGGSGKGGGHDGGGEGGGGNGGSSGGESSSGGSGSGKGNSGSSNDGGDDSSGDASGRGSDGAGDDGDDDSGDDNSGSDDSANGRRGSINGDTVGGGHDRVVRHEIVVAGDDARLPGFAAGQGFRVLQSQRLAALGLSVTRLQAPEGVSPTEAKAIIVAAFPTAIVDFNHLYQPQASMTLPATGYPMKAMHWLPELQSCGASARLGLIDTAVTWSAPVLDGAHGRSQVFLDGDMRAASPQHGTGIASLLVGQHGFGLMPAAALYSAAIFGVDADDRPIASATSFAAALNWLVANEVATINVSLSGPPDRLMELAVARAQALGARLVAAVGNDGTTGVPRYPAAYPGVIGVTAVDPEGEALSAGNRGAFVAVAAPGVDIWIPQQPGAGGATTDLLATGTSFAAPYVTAALAAFGNDTAGMLATAKDLGAPGLDPIYGHGLVQAPPACRSTTAAR